MKEKNKVFFKMPLIVLILMIAFPLMLLCGAIAESPNENWWVAFLSIPEIIVIVILISAGFFNPIVIMDEGVKYRGKIIKWEDVCITLLPYEPGIKTKNYRNGYYVIFDNEFVQGKVARKRLSKGKWVMLSKKSLISIINYYNKPFRILSEIYKDNDMWGTIRSRKEYNQIINDHNAKYTIE